MAEYLEKEAFKSWMKENITKNSMILTAIDCAPSADVEPVRHGHWITDAIEFYQMWKKKRFPLEKQPYLASDCVACSICLRIMDCIDAYIGDAMYCKHCGAKMDEENGE